ncbi:hypothetical protein CH35J_003468 [Colletotrichum higginsianum]|uniref:Uncharacterized protein n=1 Tax=Colletotrichum higginsianum TaxID=80884 RepID=A0A4T0W857_9PEZI|nr:hypothetical protein CH35J_003468 [Colletotrichum higginsianum]
MLDHVYEWAGTHAKHPPRCLPGGSSPGQHDPRPGARGKSRHLALWCHQSTDVVTSADRQAQHHDSVHPAVDQRRQASSTTPATTGYYYSRPSTFTTGYNYCPPTSASAIYDVGTGTATSSSVFSSSTATATDYGRAARLQSSTAAAAAASTSHHHSHLYDHD